MKYTLITGAASGLGKELARIYAENGNNLLLIDYDEENLNKVNEELKEKYKSLDFKIYCCDLSNIDNMEKEPVTHVVYENGRCFEKKFDAEKTPSIKL